MVCGFVIFLCTHSTMEQHWRVALLSRGSRTSLYLLVSLGALCAMQNQDRMRKWVYFSMVPLRGYRSSQIL